MINYEWALIEPTDLAAELSELGSLLLIVVDFSQGVYRFGEQAEFIY